MTIPILLKNLPEEKIIYIFDCPVHGRECEVFCFRALDKDNADRWRKYHTIWRPVEWEDGELEATILAARSKT